MEHEREEKVEPEPYIVRYVKHQLRGELSQQNFTTGSIFVGIIYGKKEGGNIGTPCLDSPYSCPSKADWIGTIRCCIPGCGKVAIGMADEDGRYYCEEHMMKKFGHISKVF